MHLSTQIVVLIVVILQYILYAQVELVCRMVTVLLQTHHSPLISTPSAKPILIVLKEILYSRVKVNMYFGFLHVSNPHIPLDKNIQFRQVVSLDDLFLFLSNDFKCNMITNVFP